MKEEGVELAGKASCLSERKHGNTSKVSLNRSIPDCHLIQEFSHWAAQFWQWKLAKCWELLKSESLYHVSCYCHGSLFLCAWGCCFSSPLWTTALKLLSYKASWHWASERVPYFVLANCIWLHKIKQKLPFIMFMLKEVQSPTVSVSALWDRMGHSSKKKELSYLDLSQCRQKHDNSFFPTAFKIIKTKAKWCKTPPPLPPPPTPPPPPPPHTQKKKKLSVTGIFVKYTTDLVTQVTISEHDNCYSNYM